METREALEPFCAELAAGKRTEAGLRQTRPAGLPAPRWRTLSAAARGRFLRALEHRLQLYDGAQVPN